jgi:hypothetical protein
MSNKLAGPIGLLKQYVSLISLYAALTIQFHRFITRCGRETAEDATQVFGGRAITKTGMGRMIEAVRPFFSSQTSYS